MKKRATPCFVNQHAITLSGGDQVVLMLKGNKSWNQIIRETIKPWRPEDYIFSWFIAFMRLKDFEKKHGVKFLYSKRYEKIYWRRTR